jgi:hypothetical protein
MEKQDDITKKNKLEGKVRRNGEKEELHLSRIFMQRVKAVTLTARKLIFYLDLLPGAKRERERREGYKCFA